MFEDEGAPIDHAGGQVELVVMLVGAQRCALRLCDVQEIVRAVAVTPLPGAPPITEGVVDVRGDVVPVLDVRQRIGQPPRAVRLDDHFVIARAATRTVALRADGAVTLASVSPEAVRHAAAVTPARYVAGFVTLADGLAVVTDLATFLSAAESGAIDRALARVGVAGAGTS